MVWLTQAIGLFLPLGNGITTNLSVTNDTSSSETKGTRDQDMPRDKQKKAQFCCSVYSSVTVKHCYTVIKNKIPVNNCSNLIMKWNPNESHHRTVDFLAQF